jgi:hypothetical protein
MELTYRRITPGEFEKVRQDPGQFDPFGEDYPRSPEDLEAERATGKVFRLDKEWQALHFLLTGDASLDPARPPVPPLGNVVRGGSPTPMEATFGPVRYLTPDEVREVAEALRSITAEELHRRFDSEEFNRREIYPNPRPGGWDEWQLEPLLEMYPEFVEFFRRAAEAGDVVLLSLD